MSGQVKHPEIRKGEWLQLLKGYQECINDLKLRLAESLKHRLGKVTLEQLEQIYALLITKDETIALLRHELSFIQSTPQAIETTEDLLKLNKDIITVGIEIGALEEQVKTLTLNSSSEFWPD